MRTPRRHVASEFSAVLPRVLGCGPVLTVCAVAAALCLAIVMLFVREPARRLLSPEATHP